MNDVNWRAALAEGIAVFLFVFLGPGVVVVVGGAGSTSNLIAIALGHGLAIMLLVSAIGHISGGHINPAVTIAAWVTKRISMQNGIAYLVAQLVGAALGALVLGTVVVGSIGDGAGTLGDHALGMGIEPWEGVVIEIILTFALVLVVFGAAMDKRGVGNLAPLAIGLVIVVDHLVGVPLTGASMNPARTFGPALIAGAWDNHWVYWVGPIVGAVIAGFGYKYIFQNNSND